MGRVWRWWWRRRRRRQVVNRSWRWRRRQPAALRIGLDCLRFTGDSRRLTSGLRRCPPSIPSLPALAVEPGLPGPACQIKRRYCTYPFTNERPKERQHGVWARIRSDGPGRRPGRRGTCRFQWRLRREWASHGRVEMACEGVGRPRWLKSMVSEVRGLETLSDRTS